MRLKRLLCTLSVALGLFTATPAQAQLFGKGSVLGSVLGTAMQAFTLTNAQVQQVTRQYITQLDAKSVVCGESDSYTKRLNRLTGNLKEVKGTPLNFKVYRTNELNAFACADGSVRVYSGLMDILTDDELLGVIGHELGHVYNEDTKDQYKHAILTAAAQQGMAASGGILGQLSQGTLGKIGEALSSASYSRKQESAADDFGYDFLKSAGRNPWAMATSFIKLQQAESSAGASAGGFIQQFFSDHPTLQKRIKHIEQRAKRDGYKKPANLK